MAGIDKTVVIDQIDKVLAEFPKLRVRSKYEDLSDLADESEAFFVRLRSAIERLAPVGTPYLKEMQAVADDRNNTDGIKLRGYMGILRALRADVDSGWVTGISELLHADTFSDFLDQADELVNKKYKDAAAVIAGSTLEAHLRLLCGKYSVALKQPGGQPKRADTMNADIVKAGGYNTLQAKAITGWLAIRNSAAHGKYAEYTEDQVRAMIASIRDFILRYPA